jgi:hypothetical protein
MNKYDYKKYASLHSWLDPNFYDCGEFNFFYTLSNKDFGPIYRNQREEIVGAYHILKNTYVDGDYNGGEPFDYKYNTYGFRSQHFENCKPGDVNILFSGCSWTEGSGLPDEMVWRYLLTEKLKALHPEQNVEQYSVGVGGASIPLIFKNTLSFLRKNKDVSYVYILLPGFDRAGRYDPNVLDGKGGFRKINYVSPESEIFKIPVIKNFVINYEPADSIYTTLPLLKAIEDICELREIKLYWGTWSPLDQEVYEDFDFNSYVKMPQWSRMSIQGAVTDKTYFKIAADGHHPGLEHMTEISDAFYEATING